MKQPEFNKYGKIIRELPLLKPDCESCGRTGVALNDDLLCLGCYFRLDQKNKL